MIFKDGSPEEQVASLVEALKGDGYDFTVGIPMDTPIVDAERVVSAGKGIGEKENMKLIEELAHAAGAAVGSSRPVAETLQYVPIERYVGMSGQKFKATSTSPAGFPAPSSTSRASRMQPPLWPSTPMPVLRSSKTATTGSSVMSKSSCRS